MCPYCPKVDNPNNDEYLVRIYATRKSNKSFGDNPEGVLQGWNHNHRKILHPKEAAYPGGLKYIATKKDSLTGKRQQVETVVNKSNCMEFYQTFEFSKKEWSRINGLKRKQTSQFKKGRVNLKPKEQKEERGKSISIPKPAEGNSQSSNNKEEANSNSHGPKPHQSKIPEIKADDNAMIVSNL